MLMFLEKLPAAAVVAVLPADDVALPPVVAVLPGDVVSVLPGDVVALLPVVAVPPPVVGADEDLESLPQAARAAAAAAPPDMARNRRRLIEWAKRWAASCDIRIRGVSL